MLRDRGPRDGQTRRDGAERGRAQRLQHGPTGRVGEGREGVVRSSQHIGKSLLTDVGCQPTRSCPAPRWRRPARRGCPALDQRWRVPFWRCRRRRGCLAPSSSSRVAAPEDDAEVDRRGGVHARIGRLEVVGEAGQLLVELGHGGLDVEVGGAPAPPSGGMVKNPNRKPPTGGKYGTADGRLPSSGNAGVVSPPQIRWNSLPGSSVVTGATDSSLTNTAFRPVVPRHHSSDVHALFPSARGRPGP